MTVDAAVSLQEIEQFVYREARFQDEHDYDAWEALWTDDAIYWVPAGGADYDPTRQMSIIFDNRARIGTRIKQLKTGKRHAQTPPSNLRRLVSNVELLGEEDGDLLVAANFMIVESRERGTQIWAGRSEYKLRPDGDELRMAYKKVILVDNERAIYTLAFLGVMADAVGEVSSEFASVAVSVDSEGNGPRLRVEDLKTGHVGYLDALELETLAWLPEGALHTFLDPSFIRWKDDGGSPNGK